MYTHIDKETIPSFTQPHTHTQTHTKKVHEQRARLREISRKCVDAGFAIVCAKYKIGETFEWTPTLRLSVSATHTQTELQAALDCMKKVVGSVTKR